LRRNLLRTPSAQKSAVFFAVAMIGVLTVVLLSWNANAIGSIELRQGQVAPYDIVAPTQISYVSDILTEQARERAANAVPNQYDSAAGTIRRQQVLLSRELTSEIAAIIVNNQLDDDAKVVSLLALVELALTPESAGQVVNLSMGEWAEVAAEVPSALDRIMREDIREEDLAGVQQRAASVISADLSEDAADVSADLVRALVRANTFFNEERTATMRDEARENVAPQTVTIARDEVILREGDVATAEDLEALTHIGALGDAWNWWNFARAAIFTILLLTVTVGALYRLRTRTWHHFRELSILVLLTMLWLAGAKFMIVPHAWLPYLFPMAAYSMLIACLVHVRVAVVLTVSLGLVVHYIGGNNPILVLYMIAGGFAGSLVLARAERISVFLWAALAVAATNVAAMAAYRLPFDMLNNQQLLQLVFVMLLNGGLSASIALLGYFALGNLFGLTTSLQLNELSRPTHPLLRQLLLKAPGTYHHTIVVSNMAERAAAAIGADALLARVGAYYHDIGKTVRPYFFTENIAEGVSPHDKLDPETSAQIIISHVTDGIDLAQKYRLPRRIQDFIREHHGRSLVQYFYVRALRENRDAGKGETVREEDFRYPGPRPQSRETGVLALADTCEAAVRAMRPATREELAKVVNRLIDERAADGELNECDLTFADVEIIREVFQQVLAGVHHPRVSYPESPAQHASTFAPATPAIAVTPQAASPANVENGESGAPARPVLTEASVGNGASLHPPAEIDGAHPHVVMANEGDKRLPAGVEEPESPEMISVDKAG